MRGDDVNRLLKELPRHEASHGFTERVLERLDRDGGARSPRRASRWMIVPAVAALLLAVWIGRDVVRERQELPGPASLLPRH